jgi:hypothetical protein
MQIAHHLWSIYALSCTKGIRQIPAMNTLAWLGQAVLAGIFVLSGALKTTWTRERLVASGQTGVAGLSRGTIRFVGVSELLGGAGVVLPWATHIARWLTPLAAAGLALIMVLAAPIHARRREPRSVAINIVLFSLAVGVAWLRFNPQ